MIGWPHVSSGQRDSGAGFTLIELIVVMVILGVLAISALPSFLGSSDIKSSGYREQVVTALRYAQKAALSHRRLVCAAVNGSGVTLTVAQNGGATSCNLNLAGPGGGSQMLSNPDGFSISPPATTLYFQPSGQVTSDAAGTTPSTFSITVNNLKPVSIDGRTGYAG